MSLFWRRLLGDVGRRQRPLPATEWLVAHRGFPRRFPENSLLGLEAALAAGAHWLEVDVQLTGDGIPVVLHDRELQRLTGLDAHVSDLPLAALEPLRLNPPALADALAGESPIPTLQQVLALMAGCPHATLFVELKRPSIRHFNRHAAVEAVAPLLRGRPNIIPISFDLKLVEQVRERIDCPIGWVIRRSDAAVRKRAGQAGVDWLFCRHDRLPEPLWSGHRWAAYTINDFADARLLHYQGVDLVETDDIGGLLAECSRQER